MTRFLMILPYSVSHSLFSQLHFQNLSTIAGCCFKNVLGGISLLSFDSILTSLCTP